MKFNNNFSLKEFNTFGIDAKAKIFFVLKNESDIAELFSSEEFKNNKYIFLGGGSNVLFTKDYDGLVVLNDIKGVEIIKEDIENVFLKVASGENWHDLVMYTVEKDWWGMENLALIPGTVGASPIQNIGAYGVEVKDTIEEIEAYEISTSMKRVFKKEECNFGYRESIFKQELKNKYFIASVIFKLSKNKKIQNTYKVLAEYIEENKLQINKSKDMASVVISIRQNKLPDPKILGNCGSFFKNVFVDLEKLEEIKKNHQDVPFFTEEDKIKIPTAWLIDKLGLKGFRVGDVGIHEKQALVIVNYGNATGEDIASFAQNIINTVYKKWGIVIQPEVNFV
jgi:UDP-N-acetylmuramate dehydrogenase